MKEYKRLPEEGLGWDIDPVLSVIMPVHADNSYLDMAISSVLRQSQQRFELLIVVNGRAQDLAERLYNRYRQDARVRIFYTPMPGLPFALNFGISVACSEIIVRMDSDDLCEPQRLARIKEILDSSPDISVLGSAFSVIDEHGGIMRSARLRERSDRMLRLLLPFRCELQHPTVAFRRSLVLQAGGYSYGALSEDYDLWLRLRRDKRVKFHVVSESLLRYRRHSEQATSPKNNLDIFAYDVTLKLREFLLERNPIFLAGAAFSVVDLLYKYIALAKIWFRRLGS